MIFGRSQSGKTTFAVKLIQCLLPQVDQAIICSPTYKFQEVWNPIRSQIDISHQNPDIILKMENRVITREIGDEEEQHEVGKKPKTKRLLIFDDVSFERIMNQGNKGWLNSLAYNAVWYNMSIVIIAHMISNVGAGMRTNSEFLFLFNPQTKTEQENIWKTFGISRTKHELEMLVQKLLLAPIQSGENKHPFLMIKLGTIEIFYNAKEKLNITQTIPQAAVKPTAMPFTFGPNGERIQVNPETLQPQ